MNTVSNPECSHCKSRELEFDGLLKWSEANQEYQIKAVFDSTYCEQCECEVEVDWIDVPTGESK